MNPLIIIFGVIGIGCMILEEIVCAEARQEISRIHQQKNAEMQRRADDLHRQYAHRMNPEIRRRFENLR
ncbi:MAG: hypothetical protein R2941_16200 [Desulfobacterales bacterium]